VAVTSYYGYLICVIDGEVGIYEDEEVGYGFGEREGGGEECPGVRIGVEDNDEARRIRTYSVAMLKRYQIDMGYI